MGTMLIYIGLLVAVVGFAINMAGESGIPLLPGGVIPQDDSFTVFFPIVVAFIVSVLLTVFFRLFK